ncbi:2-oxoglutarate dehydrogenase E1 component [Halorhodospira halophila]|uniref:2-oxoglutarate dehydrogenase E1 component n=1 Tax=Halorhodospira halophila (strain DSM 244 / SL1) TaxID=349124 RepID=A1WW00_HALHL|nr:2-oxoglutarate dehydrogenase E1 component [Halorhodospira halophila]ABM61862.1 2-oxoglutarate dehydrogenase E1 component [Halorhodospira halophila SL1]MBK1729848.1 2-oxoglutarate dehydrogenase subunit E1 [Halorhodospira halophila]
MTDRGLFEQLRNTSHLHGANAAFIEDLYETYLADPSRVDPEWRAYFHSLTQELGDGEDIPHSPIRARFEQHGRDNGGTPARASGAAQGGLSAEAAEKQAAVLRLINSYRFRGHQAADIDPLDLRPKPPVPDLDPAFHGLSPADLDQSFNTGSLFAPTQMPLREIIAQLEEVYCGPIGSEYMHITDTAQKRWIQERLEGTGCRPRLGAARKKEILERLTAAEGIEKYLHSKYVGQKRFSLEGGDALIPLLHDLIQGAGREGVKEMVLGMAHRGRLNVLINIMGKDPGDLFAEFEGHQPDGLQGSGDVKYHMGFSSDIQTPGGPMHVALAFNPSHLEIVNPVVEGSCRGRMRRRRDPQGKQVLPLLIHGDAAFAGQGVVMETFQLSQARGFYTGGTVHVVVNNQIGFTTSHPQDTRSSHYCTEVAKIVQAPIFHVNGDDPEAVAFTTALALDYRNTFRRDVVIDLICYRRHGHNEADEPAATQPMMYQKIRNQPPVRQRYAERLVQEGILGPREAEEMVAAYREALENREVVASNILTGVRNDYAANWARFVGAEWNEPVETAVDKERLRGLQGILDALPDGFELNPRVASIMESRRKMVAGALPLDWGFAETMAYATLLQDGYRVRLTGQDSGRGTFFHRHAVLHNARDGSNFVPLQDVTTEPQDFVVIDSLLSEEAVLGFEYGYATTEPDTLTIWEAQFGDFTNGAQVVIDQFIAAAEAKWGRLSGLTMFLPHGYEGQGPEHSSARLERYLQLCAEYNMQVCVPTTPAQFFHMLRRQMLRRYRKPLVVLTPKSLLRHKLSTSGLDDLTGGHFHNIIDEVDDLDPAACRRVVLCAGKVYYDLLEARRRESRNDVAIIRVEQLYPFPERALRILLAERYAAATEVVWCQEEPKNQGAWYSTNHHLYNCMGPDQRLRYAGRAAAASPAVGYPKRHHDQQRALVEDALA